MLATAYDGHRGSNDKPLPECDDRQSAFARLSELTLAGANGAQLRRLVTEIARECLSADFSAFFQVRAGRGDLRLTEGSGWPAGTVGRAAVGGGAKSQAGYTLVNRDPVLSGDLTDESRFEKPHMCREHQIRCGISVRVAGVETVYGVLGVYSQTVHRFEEHDLTFLQILANHLALALDLKTQNQAVAQARDFAQDLLDDVPAGFIEWDLSALSLLLMTLRGLPESDIHTYLQSYKELDQSILPELRLKNANTYVLKLLQVPNIDALQDQLAKLIQPARGEFQRELLGAVGLGRPATFNALIQTAKGRTLRCSVQVVPDSSERLSAIRTWITTQESVDAALLYAGQSQTRALMGALSRERALSSELEGSLLREKELSVLKSRFVAMASHEFRTPLSAILAAAGSLKSYGDKMTPAQQLDRLNKIHDEVDALVRILDDILEVGRNSDPSAQLQPRWFNLPDLCHSIVSETETLFGIKDGIHTELPSGLTTVFLDPRCLRNILGNLLTNAVKYSDGHPAVQLRIGCGDHEIKFQVQDQGVGMSKEDQAMILEPFFRGKNVGNRPGNGLGLAIVHRSVLLHGGQFHFYSELAKGSTFTVTLPCVMPVGEGS